LAIYGIDLGTSNCLTAKLDQEIDGTFNVRCLKDKKGNESFPSIVYFKNNEEYYVGEKALEELYRNPDSTMELVKIRMGKQRELDIKIGNERKKFTPQEISSLILKHFNALHGNGIKKAVLTVPAFFDQNQKAATKEAGILAGIDIVELIEEPSAAIMHHIFAQYKAKKIDYIDGTKPKYILVFDFGGGTLDLSLVRVSLDKRGYVNPEVLITEGDSDLGGNLIDFEFAKNIIDYVADENPSNNFIQNVKTEYDYYYENYKMRKVLKFRDGVSDRVKKFIFQMKNTLEMVKIQLSSKTEATIDMEAPYESIDIDRDYFEEDILEQSEIPGRIVDAVKRLLDKNEANYAIDQVILVGGTSQIPYFKKLIEKEFPKIRGRVLNSPDYHNAIAQGAAIIGAIKDGISVPPFGKNTCKSVVSHSLYVKHEGQKDLFIKYGMNYPFTAKQEYTFKIRHSLDTNIKMQFLETYNQGNKPIENPIKDISFFHPCFYTEDQIAVTLEIDEAGIYKFTARHCDTDEKIQFESEKLFTLSDEEIVEIKAQLQKMRDVV
jgi:molecular chaperone DnaK